MKSLPVTFSGRQVGTLSLSDDGRFRFSYSDAWKNGEGVFSVSASLPLDGEYSDEVGHRFFQNLLPEGDVRDLLSRRFGISRDNDFALISRIGGECAGALVIGEQAEDNGYVPLSDKQLANMAEEGGALGIAGDTESVRLSLAGAQDKLPVLVEKKGYFLPQGDSASTHILKFPNRRFKRLVENEQFTMLLAKRLGLPTCETSIDSAGGYPLFVISRYDRVGTKRHIERLHQEDMCQALGYPPSQKYQTEGGPSFGECVDIVTSVCQDRIADTFHLVQWLAFCVLARNADGHAKNLSLVRSKEGDWRLAPFYDLVCTGIYPKIATALAMQVGENSDPGKIRGRDWETLANEAKVGKKLVLDLVADLGNKMPQEAKACAEEFRDRFGDSPVLQQIVPLIRKQSRRTLELLSE